MFLRNQRPLCRHRIRRSKRPLMSNTFTRSTHIVHRPMYPVHHRPLHIIQHGLLDHPNMHMYVTEAYRRYVSSCTALRSHMQLVWELLLILILRRPPELERSLTLASEHQAPTTQSSTSWR